MRSWMQRALYVLALGALLPVTAAAQSDARIARGRYLGESIVACGNCHTPKGPQGEVPGMELAGGFVIDIPGAFRAVIPNITQDAETGIGRWTDAQIAVAIREGKRPDGSIIGPPMPFELYRQISDDDLAALVAWLRTIKPVRNQVARSTYSIPLPPSYGPPVTHVPQPADNPVARGAYLTGPLGHCMECHTPTLANGQRDWARMGAGGMPIPGPMGPVVPRNITPSPSGIGGWTDAQIRRAITEGISADGRPLSPPMAFPYYARINATDMADIIAYLRSLKPEG